jgi:hypothetical protein
MASLPHSWPSPSSANPLDQAIVANAAYQAKDWTRAKTLYSELVQVQPETI